MNLKEAVADACTETEACEKEEAKAIQVKLPGRRSGCTCNTVQEFT
jgi:hypothetical protein